MIERIRAYIRWWAMWRTVPVRDWLRGAALYREGKFDAAATYYERGLKTNPQHAAAETARLDYAYCLFQLRKLDQAKEELRKVIGNSPRHREARVRLARLQLWAGEPLDAAHTCRRALQALGGDAELVALFLLSSLEHGADENLTREAVRALSSVPEAQRTHTLLRVANAQLDVTRGELERGRQILAELANLPQAPFDGVVLFAELLMSEGNIAHARHHLRRALRVAANHPRVLSLLAESYLKSGAFYSPDYAVQLSQNACQHSGWLSPREMHVLAEAYRQEGNKVAALLVAAKAREVGSRLIGAYRDNDELDRLIADLSSGTQA